MEAMNLDIFDIKLLMVMGLFILGAITLLVGIILLITRSAGKEVRSLATQTAKLARKGIAEDVSGLVGNASSLLSATNELCAHFCRYWCVFSCPGFPADGSCNLAGFKNLLIQIRILNLPIEEPPVE